MAVILALLFPVALLLLLLGMEQVERPLRAEVTSEDLAEFLESARLDEVEMYVSRGFAPAVERYWRRRRLIGLLPGHPES